MRIGLVSTVSAPVNEDATGSVEAWTWLMARELTRLGHQITVFGCQGSRVEGEIVVTLPGPYGAPGGYDDWQLCEWINLCRAVEQAGRFDILHTQAYLWGMPLQKLVQTKMVHTLHIVPDTNSAHLWESSPESCVTAISHQQWGAFPHLRPAAVIPHGVDLAQFTFNAKPDDYVLFLGRFTSGKGPLQAIEAARSQGVRLVMAGPENAYFREKVKPWVDGRTIQYAGYARPADRNKLLGGARALLYPIQYPESFGLVLVEAMLCGTPVVGLRHGAVEEIVEEGVSGFTATTSEDFGELIPRCFALDRHRIRQGAQARFSAERMTKDYVKLYEQLCPPTTV
jgi:glycosyltransferase involved in cell wall biosynthesis